MCVFISKAIEFTGNNEDSAVRDIINCNIGREYKNKLLSYMNSYKYDTIIPAPAMDYIKNEPLNESIRTYNDGMYLWSNEVVYHFKQYDLKLNDDFIEHVLNKMKS